jgi:anti-sigma B factor antagonist
MAAGVGAPIRLPPKVLTGAGSACPSDEPGLEALGFATTATSGRCRAAVATSRRSQGRCRPACDAHVCRTLSTILAEPEVLASRSGEPKERERGRVPSPNDFGLADEEVDERTHVVAPAGEIDALTAPQLGRRLLGLVDDGKTHVVVDLSSVTFLDSTGIGVLLNALRFLGRRRGRLAVVCPTKRVLRPFEVTGLVDHLAISSSREEALGRLAASY